MREYREPTCRNLFKRPLVMGVPVIGLACLGLVAVALQMGLKRVHGGDYVTLATAIIGYVALRLFARFAKPGAAEKLIFWCEQSAASLKKEPFDAGFEPAPSSVEIVSPDTADSDDLIRAKESLRETLSALVPGQKFVTILECQANGVTAVDVEPHAVSIPRKTDLETLMDGIVANGSFVYSLVEMPSATDPLWAFGLLRSLPQPFKVIVTFRGLDPQKVSQELEGSRKRCSGGEHLSEVQEEVTFEESSQVLEGIVRGDDAVIEAQVVIVTSQLVPDLERRGFCLEGNPVLTVASALGQRMRLHRSHRVRLVTATDLIPNIADPFEAGTPVLKTVRGNDCYFDPMDSRLEALHWLVVGASGTGKSFVTGVILKRLVEQNRPLSVLFVDHNRSFRRFLKGRGSLYLEPQALTDLSCEAPRLYEELECPGVMVGVELSDLALSDKKEASRRLLTGVEAFLRRRRSTHVIYIVLDECWNFLREDPELVQRAFREYRKLNGAAVAITQSLRDFLSDESGQSILQNAPIRILLRQGEDLEGLKSLLNLNSVELRRLRYLQQKKGVFSECLVKTPFLSRIGRLYPTSEEHDSLRTDNLREEFVREALSRKEASHV